ncbi:uncharacterized protein PRCAT00003944001 [Priceomyces carsonii]|uniref:uncharacterized protein n=1 Tax=Priceomyces carsonii TaxID=28549 RepID=UPI002ED9FCFB|nr:unnamed protein product [Priceomyces carsonii]
MALNDITPPSRKVLGLSKGHKRQIIESIEEENTFLPPALSSYSIALLNEKTSKRQTPTSNKVTGIYELDFPDGKKSGSFLKSKLSVHFKESNQGEYTGNNSFHNASHTSFQNESSGHSAQQSYFAGSHNISGYSFNQSSNVHTGSEEDIMEAASPHNSLSKLSSNQTPNHTPATTPGDNPPMSSNSNASRTGSIHTIKRTRGTMRFGKILGPPKRASKSVDERPEERSDQDVQHENQSREETQRRNLRNSSNTLSTPPPAFPMNFSPKLRTPIHLKESSAQNSESVFIDSAKQETHSVSPEVELLTKEKEIELRRRIEEQKSLNELRFKLSKSRHDEMEVDDPENKDIEKDYDINLDTFKSNINGRSISDFKIDKRSEFESQDGDDYRSDSKSKRLLNEDKENMIFEGHDNSSQSKHQSFRQPLVPISSNVLNTSHEDEGFRKPKLPRSSALSQISALPQQEPQQHPQSGKQATLGLAGSSSSDDNKKKKSIVINGNNYEKLELLGRGGSSKVYKVKATSKNRLYAIKKVTFDQFDETCVKGFKGEIDLLLKLKDADRVVKLIDHAIGEGSIYLVMECGDIDLAHVFQTKLNMNNPLDLNFVKYHSIEILRCVEAVHEAGIVHSDLKPANFLFVRGVLKIIDFGIANAVPDHTANIYRESQIGTPNYMAPEALIEVNQTFPGLPLPSNQQELPKNTWKVGKPSDVWSCGCIIYQMIYGKPPYGGYSGNQRIMAIINPQVKILFPVKGIGNIKVPQSAVELMQNCLSRNPNERWTVDQCLNSDFLNPKIVSETFIRDLVHLAVNFGYNNRLSGSRLITADVYDRLVDTVLKQIESLNYG